MADAVAPSLKSEMSIYFVKLEYPIIHSAWILYASTKW